ncbi:enduracididine biosynthesis enzyme MppQ [Micromonospora sp. NPDC048170]|uniref:enduracididine biosynthesis enzyme MppQ n=1 Tax=Micromonospora sp. NPDC048170 TaxID=3154819 RepID=UPI0033D50D63
MSGGPYWRAGVVQSVAPPGTTDLGPGYLDPALLPVRSLARAYARALDEFGPAALTYGENRGPAPLREALAARAGTGPDHVLVTAGASQGLHLVAGTLTRPGDVVLAEPLSYDYGLRVLTDRELRIQAVESDADGPVPGALTATARRIRRGGERVAFAYLIPTYRNPTGVTVPAGRRRALVAEAADAGVPIVEDDAYAGLRYDGPPEPPSLHALAGRRGVVRLGTFAKTLAPGLRLGWIEAEPRLVRRFATAGWADSGGGFNHLAALAVATLLAGGGYDRHLAWLRGELRARRDAFAGALGVAAPHGGFFVWLPAPDGDGAALRERAAAAGVSVADGRRFGAAGAGAVRAAFSFHPPHQLADAGARLAAARTAPARLDVASTSD